MSKPTDRPYSRYTREALRLMGQAIQLNRKQRKLTAEDLASRAGISRALLRRIEGGDPGSSIGAVFEAAALVGVPLFAPDLGALTMRVDDTAEKLTLLPKTVRAAKAVKDDF